MRRRLAAGGALLALLVAGLVSFLGKGTSELPVYTEAAARMARGAEIYRPQEAKPFTYPPGFALPFLPFNVIPLHRTVWYFANVAVLVWLVLILRAVAVTPFAATRARRVLFWAVVAALAARHVLATLANQSHDLLVALCLALAAREWGREREGRAGLWAGVGAALKATPLLLLVPFAVQRRPKLLAAAVLSLAAVSLLPDLLFPREDGALWIAAWYRTALEGVRAGAPPSHGRQWSAGNPLNQSLAGTLYRLGGPRGPLASTAGILAGQLAVLVFIAASTLRRPCAPPGERALQRLGEVGLVGCGMVLLSPMSSKSHFCVLLLPAAYGAARLLLGPRDRLLRALLCGSFVAGTLSSGGLVGRALADRLLDLGALTWSALLLLLATGRALRTQRQEVPTDGGATVG